MSNVIPEKPNLSLYVGRTIEKVYRLPDAQPWDWYIQLSGGILIRNYSRDEVHMPEHLVGGRLAVISMSGLDTTLNVEMPNTKIHRWGLKPTSYTIHDPRHKGEVIPQWPEELEVKGIAPEDIGRVSDKPSEEWPEEYNRLTRAGDARAQSNAQKFLEEEDAKA